MNLVSGYGAAHNHICYRVNDSIFEAEIVGGGIGKAVKIGHSPELQSAHWAFWR
jgi:hypothetical protein